MTARMSAHGAGMAEAGLRSSAFASDALHDAWIDVRAAAVAGDTVSGAIKHFERHLEDNLAHLERALAGGWYQPRDLHVARLPKDDGSTRLLHVPAVADRVVERAILNVVSPLIDPTLSDASHAYRPGRGVDSAVRAVVELREAGLRWVARSDVDDCFPSIDPSMVWAALTRFEVDPGVLHVIRRLLGRRASARHPEEHLRGIPQGSPLSPLFMNMVLAPFDEALLARGCALIRYADDFVIAELTREGAEVALERARTTLDGMGLRMNPDKTHITSFDIGFEFLGEDFGPRYPVAEDPASAVSAPLTLFVGKQGARVRNVRGRVIVQSDADVELLNVPESKVGRLVLAGSVGLSAGARSWALVNDVPVTLLSRKGSLLGEMLTTGSPSHGRRVADQVRFASDEDASRAVATTIVCGKIRKQRVVLQRTARGRGDAASDALATMTSALAGAATAASVASLMGFEGAAAHAYFGAVGALMPPGMTFEQRSRRPPADVVNAALSYAYAILLGECVAALAAAGLQSGFGLLHDSEDRDNRPSLALDLMEEFRPWVVDAAVFALARRGELTPDHGETPMGREGIWLTSEGKRRLVEAYEKRMLTKADSAIPGFRGSIRRCLYRQAQRLALHIAAPGTHPFTECSWR